MINFESNSPEQTQAFAADFAKKTLNGTVIALI